MYRFMCVLAVCVALTGCAAVKDFIRDTNCGSQSQANKGCSNYQPADDLEIVTTTSSGRINPYSGDLSAAYLD